jgi:uncharacterized protein YcnI
MLRFSSTLLFLTLLLLSTLSFTSAHITFSVNTGIAGSTLLTALKVPHGCDLTPGDLSPKIPTLSITAYVPSTILSPLPGYVPNWPLTILPNVTDPVSNTVGSSYTWNATDGVGLPLGQFLLFPFQLTLPQLNTTNTTLLIGVRQTCATVSNLVSVH